MKKEIKKIARATGIIFSKEEQKIYDIKEGKVYDVELTEDKNDSRSN